MNPTAARLRLYHGAYEAFVAAGCDHLASITTEEPVRVIEPGTSVAYPVDAERRAVSDMYVWLRAHGADEYAFRYMCRVNALTQMVEYIIYVAMRRRSLHPTN